MDTLSSNCEHSDFNGFVAVQQCALHVYLAGLTANPPPAQNFLQYLLCICTSFEPCSSLPSSISSYSRLSQTSRFAPLSPLIPLLPSIDDFPQLLFPPNDHRIDIPIPLAARIRITLLITHYQLPPRFPSPSTLPFPILNELTTKMRMSIRPNLHPLTHPTPLGAQIRAKTRIQRPL